jgi:hypothetical protein
MREPGRANKTARLQHGEGCNRAVVICAANQLNDRLAVCRKGSCLGLRMVGSHYKVEITAGFEFIVIEEQVFGQCFPIDSDRFDV